MSNLGFPWSYSRLTAYETCPRQYEHKYILKTTKDDTNEAAIWGVMVHEAFELALTHGTPLPESLQTHQPYIDYIAGIPSETRLIEHELCLSESMDPCAWDAENAWVRGILDVLIMKGDKALVIDHKTGAKKYNLRQLKLFALLVFWTYPHINKCRTIYAWVKTGATTIEDFNRDQVATLWGAFSDSINLYRKAHETNRYIPRPSGLCRGWCPVSSCVFWSAKG
jgi:hypothetical protein